MVVDLARTFDEFLQVGHAEGRDCDRGLRPERAELENQDRVAARAAKLQEGDRADVVGRCCCYCLGALPW